MVVLLALMVELLRKCEISKWAMVLGSTGNPACAASCYVLCVAMRGNVGDVGLTLRANGEQNEVSIPPRISEWSAFLRGHRPFGSQGKQECLCYLTAKAPAGGQRYKKQIQRRRPLRAWRCVGLGDGFASWRCLGCWRGSRRCGV